MGWVGLSLIQGAGRPSFQSREGLRSSARRGPPATITTAQLNVRFRAPFRHLRLAWMSAVDPNQTNSWLASGGRNSLPVAKIPLSASEQTIEEAEPSSDRHSLKRVLSDIIFHSVHGLDRAILRAPGLPFGDIANGRGEFLDI